jgi:hypothetical protein
MEQVSLALVEKLARYLERAREDPKLRFGDGAESN